MFMCNSIMCHVWVFGDNTGRADHSLCPGCEVQGKPIPLQSAQTIKQLWRQSCLQA